MIDTFSLLDDLRIEVIYYENGKRKKAIRKQRISDSGERYFIFKGQEIKF